MICPTEPLCLTYLSIRLNSLRSAEAIEINSVTTSYYQMSAFVLFTIGRAIGTYLLRFVSSGKLLMYFSLLAMLFVFGAIFMTGIEGLYSLVAVSFSMSLMFPTIYGIALKDLGNDASLGSAGLVMAIVGGALMPPMQGSMIDAPALIAGIPSVQTSFVLPLICFVMIAIYYSFAGRTPRLDDKEW